MTRLPARGGARPEHGLYLHWAKALHARDDAVRKMVVRMREVMPWLTDADVPCIKGWAEIEVVAAKLFEHLGAEGLLKPDNVPKNILTEFRRMKLTQLAFERELLMTPAARAQINGNTSAPIDVAKLASEIMDASAEDDNNSD